MNAEASYGAVERQPTIGEADLRDRQALRRVAGLSTEMRDVTEVEYRKLRLERVLLVGVWTMGTESQARRSLKELGLLAETAGSMVVDGIIQRRESPDPATYVGSGKASEMRGLVQASEADTVICDGELSPGQLRALEDIVQVKVVDRTWLILDIFAQHARSREGKAQVSLAQMEYLLPRLRGWGESLSRQAGGRAGGATGGVGTRGPGETKIETDRRRIRSQMAKIRSQIRRMEKTRETQRQSRKRSGTPNVALAGYTNAGKSSLLNSLTGSGVLVDNSLFATLDPTIRKCKNPGGVEFTVSDTVGFVRHLPHQLVEAFRSTLEEIRDADVIVHVVDGSDDAPGEQITAVREVLADIGAAQVPEIIAINKADVADPAVVNSILVKEPHAIVVSAKTGVGLNQLRASIEADLPSLLVDVQTLVPFNRGDLLAQVHRTGEILSIEYDDCGAVIKARVPQALASELTTLGDGGT